MTGISIADSKIEKVTALKKGKFASQTVVLMYHSLYDTQKQKQSIPASEQPYAVSRTTFESHLQMIRDENLAVLDMQQLLSSQSNTDSLPKKPSVLITFDDGHESFYQHALPLLVRYQMTAVFFITPELMETRSDFCSWEQLKALKAAGMTIGGHGLTHAFIADLETQAASHELMMSKQRLDQALQQETLTLSFPGGRYQKRDLLLARQAGFTSCMSSDIGLAASQRGVFLDPLNPVPRYAIRSTTSLAEFNKMILAEKKYLKTQQAIAWIKKRVKGRLGNQLYHRLYKILKK